MDNINPKARLTFQGIYNLNVYLPISIKLKLAHTLLMSNINRCSEVATGCPVFNLAKRKSAIDKVVRFIYNTRARDEILLFLSIP